MKDMELTEKCKKCGGTLTLMGSINTDTQQLWAVKRCLHCFCHPVEEVVMIQEQEETTK